MFNVTGRCVESHNSMQRNYCPLPLYIQAGSGNNLWHTVIDKFYSLETPTLLLKRANNHVTLHKHYFFMYLLPVCVCFPLGVNVRV